METSLILLERFIVDLLLAGLLTRLASAEPTFRIVS